LIAFAFLPCSRPAPDAIRGFSLRQPPVLAQNTTMERVENSPTDRSGSVVQPSRLRSRVTNGKTPFVEADGRGPWARRWRDILAEIISDLGGHDGGLSEGQKQLARRCATIALACERMEGEAAAGKEIDLVWHADGSPRSRLPPARLEAPGAHRRGRSPRIR